MKGEGEGDDLRLDQLHLGGIEHKAHLLAHLGEDDGAPLLSN